MRKEINNMTAITEGMKSRKKYLLNVFRSTHRNSLIFLISLILFSGFEQNKKNNIFQFSIIKN